MRLRRQSPGRSRRPRRRAPGSCAATVGAPKTRRELVGGLRTPARLRIDRLIDQSRESRRDVRPCIAHAGTLTVLVCGAQLANRSAANRICSGDNPEEDHAEAVDVTLHGGRLAGEDLRCQIERCAGEIRSAVAQLATRSEVHEHHAAVIGAHDVVRLDVAMQQPCSMDSVHGAAELHPDVDHIRRGEGAAGLEQVLSVRPRTNSIQRPMRSPICSAP